MIWVAQSTDNSKWFAWSPRLWVNESGLYILSLKIIWIGDALVWLSWKFCSIHVSSCATSACAAFLKLTKIILGVREYLNGKLCYKHRVKDFPFFNSETIIWLFFFATVPHKFVTWSKPNLERACLTFWCDNQFGALTNESKWHWMSWQLCTFQDKIKANQLC